MTVTKVCVHTSDHVQQTVRNKKKEIKQSVRNKRAFSIWRSCRGSLSVQRWNLKCRALLGSQMQGRSVQLHMKIHCRGCSRRLRFFSSTRDYILKSFTRFCRPLHCMVLIGCSLDLAGCRRWPLEGAVHTPSGASFEEKKGAGDQR